jgi:hypothetical protein
MRVSSSFVVAALLALSSSACNTACDKLFRSKQAAPPVAMREGTPLVLDTQPGDVWEWQAEVTGHAREGTTITRCALLHRDARLPMSTYAGKFTLHVSLEAGKNEVSVECEGVGPVVHRSPPLALVVRLKDAPTARVLSDVSEDGTITLDAAASEQTSRQPVPLTRFSWFDKSGREIGSARTLRVHPAEPPRPIRLVVSDAHGHTGEVVVMVGPRGIEPSATVAREDRVGSIVR